MSGRVFVVDASTEPLPPPPPRELGLNIQTIDDARRWLTHPSNWIDTELYIVHWDGIVPSVTRRHGERLLREPWDTGLYEYVVRTQARLKTNSSDDDLEKSRTEDE